MDSQYTYLDIPFTKTILSLVWMRGSSRLIEWVESIDIKRNNNIYRPYSIHISFGYTV